MQSDLQDRARKTKDYLNCYMKTRSASEHFWVNHQRFLRSRGYELRPRYHSDWVPSWTLPGATVGDNEDQFEDSYKPRVSLFISPLT
ncbi:Protein kinase domain-containing protein [Mycena indigotica]|uniref:Protein kinase domain-containing protein n=1 Tax=Mycena indigotica TaxID=2126181 RepID=A0A8H6SUG3_9AGAR|nr:Protein kinase domain-containing protein [Mycena indigotica]KAF7306395.1 Protein kinase domain-containing protein [Mycena indigotica]